MRAADTQLRVLHCPQCPVASCHPGTCSYDSPLSKTFSWRTVTCNEDLNLYNLAVHGLGRDWSWPPSVYPRHVPTIDEIVGPHTKRTVISAVHASRAAVACR